ncbi:hypothetical protein BU16DRAFT_561664 [Lophium mytilinum]|uniref:Uncharacterized protein n=1 Tax=Lophium mytilinum TaxID=390894 RepID=A0A6A6QUH7_9PEZI|nr:hypothetical protein BU16DRAFT_561664 [Lophium mytilinum]
MVMRHSKDDEDRDLRREAKRQGIEFNSVKYNPITVNDVPTAHKNKFAVIQSLGRISYANYGFVPNGNTPDKPWELENKRRAWRLMQFAARCRRENRNESGWRYEIEQRLFERFDIEVACKTCRGRLWRSEMEVDPNSSNSRTSSLRDRQQKRQACACNATGRIDEYSALDSGLSELFSFRTEEPCLAHDSFTPSPTKRPDRIHGLQRTKNFDQILQSPYAHDDPPLQAPRLLDDFVKTTMNPDNGGSPLLFPFLISEAKREKGAKNFGQMETQTSFPIKHALQLQYELWRYPGNTMDVPGGPLVWFLANRGEDWRVYAGHIQEREGRPKYVINYLWGGSITGIDDTLQLILIVDFIVDWARDAFRPNILRQLRTLTAANYTAANYTDTMTIDPDVYSLQGEIQPWMEGQDIDPEELLGVPVAADAASESEDTSDLLHRFRTKTGVVKDARQIQSRLRGLVITRDNLETILQTFENPNAATRFVRGVISLLSRRCVALESEDVLDAVESQWTGHTRFRLNRMNQKPKVFVQFRISYYINPVWEQVRELTYLAATDDARELLLQQAGYRGIIRRSPFSPPECCTSDLLFVFDRLRQRSVRHDFVASLSRRTYMIAVAKPQNVRALDRDGVLHEFELSRVTFKLDEDKASPGVVMQGTVHTIYEKYRIGNREPSEPFLRASTGLDSEGRALWRAWKDGDRLPSCEKHLSKILVYADTPDLDYFPDGSRQNYCLYIMDGRVDQVDDFAVASKLIWTLFKDEIYSTVRKSKVPRNSRNYQDNRPDFVFSMDLLKLSGDIIRKDLFGWIRATAGSEPSGTIDQVRALKTWYVSKAAMLALRSSADASGVCTVHTPSA